jgi:hypothetical protein
MPTVMPTVMPTPEQIAALREWAAIHGRNWKAPLRDAWMNGDYHGFANSHYLQQVRNNLGPSWLVRFTLHHGQGWTVTNV